MEIDPLYQGEIFYAIIKFHGHIDSYFGYSTQDLNGQIKSMRNNRHGRSNFRVLQKFPGVNDIGAIVIEHAVQNLRHGRRVDLRKLLEKV